MPEPERSTYEEYTERGADREYSALDHLDGGLDRLTQLVVLLEERLSPVLRLDLDDALTSPELAPRSPLISRFQRIEDRCTDLDRIITRLDI